MFGWLKKKDPGAAPAGAEAAGGQPASAAYTIGLSGDVISLDYPKQPQAKASLADVAEVVIETSEDGPGIWWLLLGAKGSLVMAFPGGATGEDALVSRLKALPGFDESRFGDALACDMTGEFVVWRRS